VVRVPLIRYTLASAFCGSLAAAIGLAQSARFLEPPGGGRFEPGSIVRVSWTFGGPAEKDFDEMELVLSLDGGQTFPLRLTRDVPTNSESLLWRVPRLPSTYARLALRTGSGERKETETIRIVGGEFTILAETRDPLEDLRRVRGEWRTREASGGMNDLPEPRLSEGPEKVQAGFVPEGAAEPTVSSTPASDRGRRDSPLPAPRPERNRRSPPPALASLTIPLRQ
jgi:hypothetical protein